MHILLVRFSSMGDVVLQTATVNWLRALFGKKLHLTFVTAQEFVSLVEGHPEINTVIGFDRKAGEKWNELLKKIDAIDNKRPIDLILDLHATLRSFRLRLSYWNVPALTVDKRRWERFFLTKVRSPKIKGLLSSKMFGLEPQVARIISDLDSLLGSTNGVWKTQEYRRGPHQELTSLKHSGSFPLPKPYIVLAPAASFAPKRWPISSFVEVAKKLLEKSDTHVVVLAGPLDSFCEAFNEISSERFHNLQGKTTLSESMSVLAGAKLCFGNDSGMNHIAEAYGVPVVTVFGPTDPRFGFAPHGSSSVYLSEELWCKPCSTTGKKSCFRDRQYCMELISVDRALEAIEKVRVNP